MGNSVNNNSKNSGNKLRKMTQIGMLSGLATVLMLIQIPLPFFPPFYKFDFSEVPVLIGAFVLGPVAGILIELVKILLFMLISGTTTAGIGEVANFLIGCALVVPASIIYRRFHTRKGAIVGLVIGVVAMTIIGSILNAFVLLPVYARAFEMPISELVAMGTAVNASITSLGTFVALAVAPFNLLKGTVVSIVVLLLYKKISPIFKMK